METFRTIFGFAMGFLLLMGWMLLMCWMDDRPDWTEDCDPMYFR